MSTKPFIPQVVFRGVAGAIQMTIPEFAEKLGVDQSDIKIGKNVLAHKTFPTMSIEENEGCQPATFTYYSLLEIGDMRATSELKLTKGISFGVGGKAEHLEVEIQLDGSLYPSAIGHGSHPAFIVQLDSMSQGGQVFSMGDSSISADEVLSRFQELDRLPLDPSNVVKVLARHNWDNPEIVSRAMTFLKNYDGKQYNPETAQPVEA